MHDGPPEKLTEPPGLDGVPGPVSVTTAVQGAAESTDAEGAQLTPVVVGLAVALTFADPELPRCAASPGNVAVIELVPTAVGV
jgi:hypothetical protein